MVESEVFVGSECDEFIKTFPKSIFTYFKNTSLKFYIKAAVEIAIKLPINNQFFQEFQFLDPNVCLDPKKCNISNQLDKSKELFGSYNIINIMSLKNWTKYPTSLIMSR